MPKREDIKKIMIIGSGPIIIGQACEFDYSGTQACKALKEEGYEIILVNSNPATIMTDPEFADRTYIEPLVPEVLSRIIDKERPDAILPTLGGQTGLNLAIELAERGILDWYGVKLIGAGLESIRKAENRKLFKEAMQRIGLEMPKSGYAKNLTEASVILEEVGFPIIIRPSYTLGGAGGNIAFNYEQFTEYAAWGIQTSPAREVLLEESVIGWKEYELEVMRDIADNVVIVCSIENLDPMGIHTGDSITVAPAQTLTDKEYQVMRDAAINIIREIGVQTGGSNIQFAVNPENGRMVVIEMNPRVSRSSALASKATGFPIAKIAAKLSVGYTLNEIRNDITRETPACFEPAIDYCVVKFPRWSFEKFPEADTTLTTQMKSVGEVMAIGRTFKEAFQKAINSLEIGKDSVVVDELAEMNIEDLRNKLTAPSCDRIFHIGEALRRGIEVDEIKRKTGIDPWFLFNIKEIVDYEIIIRNNKDLPEMVLSRAKKMGFSDRRIAKLTDRQEDEIRLLRREMGIEPVFKIVDTCAAEFVAYTPYLYSTYEKECEANPSRNKKVIILGSGPNRIGQGIEFDFCCVHGIMGLRELGFETIMVNCNPETVSTDYDTSDRLYFEPITLENVLNIIDKEKPLGVILQFGGQTPLKLAISLENMGIKILGTSSDSIDCAEDRERFKKLIEKLKLLQPSNDCAYSTRDALKIANTIGFPVLMRPSYVLGGRAMRIIYDEDDLLSFLQEAVDVTPGHPVLIDKFLEDAIEIDVDAISDGERIVVAGVMEHIEKAGIHSGDSGCTIPPFSLGDDDISKIKLQTAAIARELNVIGLINIQYAIQNGRIYVLEVNPRASRTIPFVSKATGVPLAKLAAKIMVGIKLSELGYIEEKRIEHIAVKESVFPFVKFPNVDAVLGPEMKSTGEVMGIDYDLRKAFAKGQISSGFPLPASGKVFISVKNKDKRDVILIAKKLSDFGFELVATEGTAKVIMKNGMKAEIINKVADGWKPNIIDLMKNGEISLVINTPEDGRARKDSYLIRRTSIMENIPCLTTIDGAMVAVNAIEALINEEFEYYPLQHYLSCINKITNNQIPITR